MDASLNEQRILEAKDERIKTEKSFGTTEIEINENVQLSKRNLDGLKKELDSLILKQSRNVTNIKVHHQERFEGKSNYDIRKLFILWFDMIENFHFYPLRFGSLIGLISFFVVRIFRFAKTRQSFSYKIKEKTF